MKNGTLLIFAFFLFNVVNADSPITSTDLAKGYQDSKNVMSAKAAAGQINDELMGFLAGGGNIAEKMAVINTLSWGEFAKSNAKVFYDYLITKRKTEDKFTPSDNLCVGYLYAMGNYFNVTQAKKYAQKAVEKNPKSFTFQIVLALILAQEYFETSWCQVYRVCADVQSNEALKQDMNAESIKGIFDYIDLYKQDC